LEWLLRWKKDPADMVVMTFQLYQGMIYMEHYFQRTLGPDMREQTQIRSPVCKLGQQSTSDQPKKNEQTNRGWLKLKTWIPKFLWKRMRKLWLLARYLERMIVRANQPLMNSKTWSDNRTPQNTIMSKLLKNNFKNYL